VTDDAPNRTMNQMFVAGAHRGARFGTFALTGETPTRTNEALRERLSGALNDLEAAHRAGDDAAIEVHGQRVTAAVDVA
jgi:hypothetical protein